MRIILGSKSLGRRKVLEDMGVDFEVMTSDIDEKAIRFDDPEKLTLALANAKADALLTRITEPAILITADQVVVCAGKILEKPKDGDEARMFLRGYALNQPATVSAVVVVNTETRERREGIDVVKVSFKEIPDEVIDSLIEEGSIFNCAGGIKAESRLLRDYIDEVCGAGDNVYGLPKRLVSRFIEELKK